MSAAISESLLAGWAFGAGEIARQVPIRETAFDPPNRPLPWIATGDDDRPFRFPIIENAVKELERRRIVTPEEFARIDREARIKAFTAAKLATEDAIAKVRDVLVEDVRRGGTLREFRQQVNEALGSSAMSRSALENIYRTNVGLAYERGKEEIVDGMEDAFPFVLDVQVHDDRITSICKVMKHAGINGTSIFLRSDPEWQRLKPLRHWQCRCAAVPMSVRDAARRGIEYAQEWLRTGRRPPVPPYVDRIPAELPEGWTR